MATDLQFVHGKKKGYKSLILNGFRFTHDRTRNGSNVPKHNLMEEYKVPDSDIRRHFQMMGVIAFIPEDDVSMAWWFL